MRELRGAFGLLQNAVSVVLWSFGTMWIGAKSLWRAGVLLFRWRQIGAEVRLCGRRHQVPLYGLWDCGCGSRFEGWAFARCAICHESAAYVPCHECGLPVRNPFLP